MYHGEMILPAIQILSSRGSINKRVMKLTCNLIYSTEHRTWQLLYIFFSISTSVILENQGINWLPGPSVTKQDLNQGHSFQLLDLH